MDKVYQVFISSTFSDLENERKAVSDTLAKSGFIPSGMELFPATDQQQLEFIKRIIDRCDYYVVIVGARYGSLDGDKSFTEKEYEYAASKEIPVLAFLHKDPGKIASEKTDREPNQIKRLDSFRSRLKASRIVSFWTNTDDLRTEVLTAVTNAVNLSPGVGWVRGDQAIDPKILQDTERVRNENDQLRQRIAELDGTKLVFPEELKGPDEKLGFSIFDGRGQVAGRVEMAIKDLFIFLFEMLVEQKSEYDIQLVLGKEWAVETGVLKRHEAGDYAVSGHDIKTIRSHLEALGLMELTRQVHEYTDHIGHQHKEPYIAWSATEKGRRYMAHSLAVRRS